MTATATATKSADFVISRVFDVPREVLWKCFTEPERMKEWWGPKGITIAVSKMDLRPGGKYHYCMRTPDGQDMWGRMVYREIVPPERLVFINSFSDENGGLTRPPFDAPWPVEILSIFTLEEEPGGKTRFTVHSSAYNPTPEEQKTFDEGHGSMNTGWGGTLDKLGAYVAKLA